MAGTAGRTTLSGEGLQHQDGHSQLWVSSIPNCVAYDPAYGYEMAVIVHEGLDRMLRRQEDVFYYLTVMNENYAQPPMLEGTRDGILRGSTGLREGQAGVTPRVQLLGSGAILREVLAAADLLEQDFEVAADVWSVTSFTELRRDGLEVERWNRLHPAASPREAYVESTLRGRGGPFVAASDYMRAFADQIRPFVPGRYTALGTDGFGRSDYRVKLRSFFEVDRHHVAVAALKALADEGTRAASRRRSSASDRRRRRRALEAMTLRRRARAASGRCTRGRSCSCCPTPGMWARPGCSRRAGSRRLRPRAPASRGRSASSTSR
jgi:pyruvate dehydrogenase E1 component